MVTQPAASGDTGYSHQIAEMANAVAFREGETQRQAQSRYAAAVRLSEAFEARGAFEEMLVGHCVGFHALFIDDLRQTLAGEPDLARRATRNRIVRLDGNFARNYNWLRESQRRRLNAGAAVAAAAPAAAPAGPAKPVDPAGAAPADQAEQARMPVPAAPAPIEVAVVEDLAATNGAVPAAAALAAAMPEATPVEPQTLSIEPAVSGNPVGAGPVGSGPVEADRVGADPGAGVSVGTVPCGVRPEQTRTDAAAAAIKANPAAIAALRAGDPAGFARALGVQQPDADFLAAAALPGSPFDPRTKFPGDP